MRLDMAGLHSSVLIDMFIASIFQASSSNNLYDTILAYSTMGSEVPFKLIFSSGTVIEIPHDW